MDNKELIKALARTTQALKDIISAADNGDPYTREELESQFMDDYNAGSKALSDSGHPLAGEEA